MASEDDSFPTGLRDKRIHQRQRQRRPRQQWKILLFFGSVTVGFCLISIFRAFGRASRGDFADTTMTMLGAVLPPQVYDESSFEVLNSILNLTKNHVNTTIMRHQNNHQQHDKANGDIFDNIEIDTEIINPQSISEFKMTRGLHELLPIQQFRVPSSVLRRMANDRPTETNHLHTNKNNDDLPSPRPWAAICAMAKGEELYIDEWITYHRSLGFEGIYIYDKSENGTLGQLYQNDHGGTIDDHHHIHDGLVQIIPSPRYEIAQNFHYDMCIHQLRLMNYRRHSDDGADVGGDKEQDSHNMNRKSYAPKWLAILDIDEFIGLQSPYTNIVEYLSNHLPSGIMLVNWWMVGTSHQTKYIPFPVTYRFPLRKANPSYFTKPIMVLDDVIRSNVHIAYPRPGKRVLAPAPRSTVEKCSIMLWCVRNPVVDNHTAFSESPIAIYHYKYKSVGEFRKRKCQVGEVKVQGRLTGYKCNEAFVDIPPGTVYDSRPWQLLQHNAPEYVKQFSIAEDEKNFTPPSPPEIKKRKRRRRKPEQKA
eukprot:scaffold5383_cov222-Amphora_coffeaeformis.AAC.18